MELRNYLKIFWRRKLIILATTIMTMIVVVMGTRYMRPVYRAAAVLRIAVSAGGSLNYSDFVYADRLMNTYIEIATSRFVLDELINRLNLKGSPVVKAEIIPNTELIRITVDHGSPELAALIANNVADILVEQGNQLYTGGDKKLTEVLSAQLDEIRVDVEEARHQYETWLRVTPAVPEKVNGSRQLFELRQNTYVTLLGQYEQARFREEIQASMITVFERAIVPQNPVSPRLSLNLVLGVLIGLLGGVGLAFIFENLDSTLYSVEEIEAAAKLPVLIKIPEIRGKKSKILQNGYSPAVEAFRNLATTIQQIEQPKKVLLVLSAEPSQGKSMVVAHLAISLAEFGKNVIAIDCDTRIPTLHNLFRLPNQAGLKDALEQNPKTEEIIQKSSYGGVSVLTSGALLDHPSQVLASSQMAKLIANLRRKYDYILLDSPALLAVTDGLALAPHADGFLLVVRQDHASREAVQEASDYISKLHDKYIGLVVNQTGSSRYGNYQYRIQKKSFLGSSRIVNQSQWTLFVNNLRGIFRGR